MNRNSFAGGLVALVAAGVMLGSATTSYAAAGASSPSPSAPSDAGATVVQEATDAQATAAEEYWTPQRMMSADAADSTPEADSTQESFSPFLSVGHPKRIGKIFYHFGGKDLSCTGTVVTSNSRDSILTAGHCISYKGLKATNLMTVFVPAYYKGQAPYGKWGLKKAYTPSKWLMGGDISYDYGVVHVKSRNKIRIQSVTGANPFWIHAGWSGRATLVGYPSNKTWSAICGPTALSQKVINGHKSEYKFQCSGFSKGVSGSPLLIGPGNTSAGEGTVIGVLGGLREGGEPKVDGNTSYANRLDGDFQNFWYAYTR